MMIDVMIKLTWIHLLPVKCFKYPMRNLVKTAKNMVSCHLKLGNVGSCAYSQVTEVSQKLSRQLRARIKAMGPLTIADYMKEVLINPTAGYYQHKSVFGAAGDFITSPEVNQMFGELISVWFLNEWQKIGSPKPLQIVELGPGTGSLMKDIVKVMNQFDLHKNVSLHLVEISKRLAAVQAEKLKVNVEQNIDYSTSTYYQTGFTESGLAVFWYTHVQDIPHEFSFIIANEFFDALPIHKFERTKEGWREILIDFHPDQENVFRYVQSRFSTPATVFIKPNEKRDHVELSISSAVIVQHLASRLEEDGGISLLVDYGHDGTAIDTFRAFRQHSLHDPLVDPGSADLTADVDFSAVRDAAKTKVITYGPVSQGEFLERLGIQFRLQVLLEKCRSTDRTLLENSYHMLVDKDKMGDRFKFFAMFPAVLKEHLAKFPVEGFYEKS